MRYRGSRYSPYALIVMAACIAVAALVWLIVIPHMVVSDLSADLSGPPIPTDALANETTHPHYLSDGRNVHDDWLAAIARFADVRDCLLPEERLADDPDLRRFDWAGVRGHRNVDICLHRVFSSLGTPERAVLWMESQGFRTTGPATLKGRDAPGTLVSGGHSPSKDGVLLPGGGRLGRWVIHKLVYGESITATWSEDGRLLRAGFSSNTL